MKQMLAQFPELLDAGYPWSEKDRETAIQAAAQVGNAPIAEYLLEKGAPMEICTAAMLGRTDAVEKILAENPEQIHAAGAHSIPLLTHAALSGNLQLVQFLFQRGATVGASAALHNAVARGNYDMVKWLLESAKPDLGATNFQGKTAFAVANERKRQDIADLLMKHGALD